MPPRNDKTFVWRSQNKINHWDCVDVIGGRSQNTINHWDCFVVPPMTKLSGGRSHNTIILNDWDCFVVPPGNDKTFVTSSYFLAITQHDYAYTHILHYEQLALSNSVSHSRNMIFSLCVKRSSTEGNRHIPA